MTFFVLMVVSGALAGALALGYWAVLLLPSSWALLPLALGVFLALWAGLVFKRKFL
jgi:hypothetical protein